MEALESQTTQTPDYLCNEGEHLLFVYGTLKRGFSNFHIIKDYKFVAEAKTVGKFRLTEEYDENWKKWVPYLSKDEEFEIRGEVFKGKDTSLEFLDEFEAVPLGIYERTSVKVRLSEVDEEVTAWVYVGKKNGKYLVKDGFFQEGIDKEAFYGVTPK